MGAQEEERVVGFVQIYCVSDLVQQIALLLVFTV